MHHAYAGTFRDDMQIPSYNCRCHAIGTAPVILRHEVSPPIRKASGPQVDGTNEWNYAKIKPRLSWKLFCQRRFFPHLSQNFTNHSLPLSLSALRSGSFVQFARSWIVRYRSKNLQLYSLRVVCYHTSLKKQKRDFSFGEKKKGNESISNVEWWYIANF